MKRCRQKTVAPSHPRRVLRTGFLDEYALPVEPVAAVLGLSRGHLSRILNGRSPVTPDIALKLEGLTQTPAGQWLALQAKYDAFMLDQVSVFPKYQKAAQRWLVHALRLPPQQRTGAVLGDALMEKAGQLAKTMAL
ncbi:MAG: HigA family addiction module antitoxin [Holosporales bacterium]|jgi:addiction module HigA family antidote